MMASPPRVMAVSQIGNEKFDVLNCSGVLFFFSRYDDHRPFLI